MHGTNSGTAQSDTDIKAALYFVQTQFEHPAGPVNLWVLKNEGGGARHTITSCDLTEIETFTRVQDKPGQGVYFCVSTLMRVDQIHAKDNSFELAFAHADTDMKDIINETPESALAKIRAL